MSDRKIWHPKEVWPMWWPRTRSAWVLVPLLWPMVLVIWPVLFIVPITFDWVEKSFGEES